MSGKFRLVGLSGTSRKIRIEPQALASGGDGAIHRIDGESLVAKLYHDPGKDPSRLRKIRAMLADPPELPPIESGGSRYIQIAWPVGWLESGRGAFAGYAMPLVELSRAASLEHLLSGKGRAAAGLPEAYTFRLKVAANLARLVARLHRHGHHIIDLKPINLNVYRDTGYLALLDCDGLSVRGAQDERFPAHQYTDGYISPEALQRQLAPQALGEAQDRFALAVILFQLLNQGLHPYQGIPAKGRAVAPTNGERIREELYAYGRRANPALAPSPWSIHEFFDDDTRLLFDRAFTGQDDRPGAGEWLAHLEPYTDESSGNIQPCPANPDHVRFAKGCPWCALEERKRKSEIERRKRFASAKPSNPPSPATKAPAAPPTPQTTARRGLKSAHVISSLAAVLVLSYLFLLVQDWEAMHSEQSQRQVELKEQQFHSLMRQAGLRAMEQHWAEAEELFGRARAIHWDSVPAIIGQSQAVFRLEGAQRALDLLARCTDEKCERERKNIHVHEYRRLNVRGIRPDNVREVLAAAVDAYGPACAVEHMMVPDLTYRAPERTQINDLLGQALEERLTTAREAATRSLEQMRKFYSEIPASEATVVRIGEAVAMGADGGASVITRRKPYKGFVCRQLDKHWEKDERTVAWEYIESGVRSYSDSATGKSYIKFHSRTELPLPAEVARRLRELYELSAAKAFFDRLVTEGGAAIELPQALEPVKSEGVTVTHLRWSHFDDETEKGNSKTLYTGVPIKLEVDVNNVPDGNAATFRVYETSASPVNLVARIQGTVKDGTAAGLWRVRVNHTPAKLAFEAEVRGETSDRGNIP